MTLQTEEGPAVAGDQCRHPGTGDGGPDTDERGPDAHKCQTNEEHALLSRYSELSLRRRISMRTKMNNTAVENDQMAEVPACRIL